jgi:hypothetical protein
MDRAEITVRKMLTALKAPLYDIGVLSDRGMLPGLDSIPAAAVLDRLSLLEYRKANVRGSHRMLGVSTYRVSDLADRTPSFGKSRGVYSVLVVSMILI